MRYRCAGNYGAMNVMPNPASRCALWQWGAVAVLVALLVPWSLQQVSAEEDREGEEDAWRRSDSAVRMTNRGVALMERYEYAAAVRAFEQAAETASSSVGVRVNLAIALFNRAAKGDLQRAEVLLDEVIAADPDNLQALYFRGITHQYSGRDPQAVACFQRVVELEPREAHAWYLLARSKAHLGQPCRTELERAVRENPGLASAYYDLMRVARRAGDLAKVQEYQRHFVRLQKSPLAEMVVIPHYRQMGPLGVVRPSAMRPLPRPAGGELSSGPPRVVAEGCFGPIRGESEAADIRGRHAGLAMADVNGDGHIDVAVAVPGALEVRLLLGGEGSGFSAGTAKSGLATKSPVGSCAFGDFDNDGRVDLFVACAGPNHLFAGRGDGSFADVSDSTGTAGVDAITSSAVFLDADHDGDLDIYVCNRAVAAEGRRTPSANQLLNNNADGTFTDIAKSAGVTCAGERSLMMAPADLDGDRDTDFVVCSVGQPIRTFINDRSGKFHEGSLTDGPAPRAPHGVVLQDFNGDGAADLLILPGRDHGGSLYLSDGTQKRKRQRLFEECVEALSTWGALEQARIGDVDLDGDLDVVLFGRSGHVLLNDGWGRFVARTNLWLEVFTSQTVAAELTDLTGDGVPEVLRALTAGNGVIESLPTKLTPPANWLRVTPTGDRGEDKSTRSSTSGFGTRLELRSGLHGQVITYTGLDGGFCQSQRPLVLGLAGVVEADYMALTWPDGVTQCETGLVSGAHHRISELERRVSSCPVLFAWDGDRFGFVGDFAGVGGLGYYSGGGEYAPPQPVEHVKIDARQLVARAEFYELRLCEPMEEVAYVDRLELLAVDHSPEVHVYPDERLAITGPPPTQRLLCVSDRVFPQRAFGPGGALHPDRLGAVDRVYAYAPPLDLRFFGFCAPHSLVLDFGDRLAGMGSVQTGPTDGEPTQPDRRVYLFVNGSIEYPYSQTTYAASQAHVEWQPLKVEVSTPDGSWKTVVADAGIFGGIGRTIAIDLTGRLPSPGGQVRLSTNLEVYYDQVFVAVDEGPAGVVTRRVPLVEADLRRLGFPREYTPDGRPPTVYDYGLIEPTSSFKIPRGAYTRYGPVDSLLTASDDRQVILGSGDEIALRFDAGALPPAGEGVLRSFILVSRAYCKDMDLYTAEPDTVEPLPHRGMSGYPYTSAEPYPSDETTQRYRDEFNTRIVR
ncbi:MAG: tetratricopeptide repeat protein [bacterium]|nr:tetratricopeptide repeat protein [bacterium]